MLHKFVNAKAKRVSRRVRKSEWIGVKNLFREFPESANGGDFLTIQKKDKENGWVAVDFIFFHSKKRRFFIASAITTAYEFLEKIEVDCEAEMDVVYPYPTPTKGSSTSRTVILEDGTEYDVSPEWLAVHQVRSDAIEKLVAERSTIPAKVRPRIDVHCAGDLFSYIWFVVDRPIMDEAVIRECVSQFRELGEKIETGRVWESDEVEVVAELALS